MNTVPVQSGIKVWRPQGFEGLEVEVVNHASDFLTEYLVLDYEITTLLVGKGTVNYRRETVKARASLLHPFLYIQSPDEMVEAGNLHKEPISFWTLRYKPAFIQQLLEDHLEYGTVLPAFPRTTVENSSLNQELALATQRAVQAFLQPTSRLMRQTLILNLLVETFRHCADRPQREQRLGFEHHAVKKIKEYLRQHFTSEVSLEDLSSLTKLNKYHLLQIFKRDVGISPHIYQTSLRIHRAKQQLATGASIAQVALDVGFVDQSHFGRQFKKYVRVTPGQFQRDSLSS